MNMEGLLSLTVSPFVLNIVELQWLEHRLLVYHGCFELRLSPLDKNPIAADLG